MWRPAQARELPPASRGGGRSGWPGTWRHGRGQMRGRASGLARARGGSVLDVPYRLCFPVGHRDRRHDESAPATDRRTMSHIPSRVLHPGRRLTALAGAAAITSLVLTACGSGASGGTAAGGSGSSTAAGDCGTVPDVAPKDPQHVLAGLPHDVSAAYNGYTGEVLPSAWAGWKPTHPAPYKVAILSDPPVNAFQTTLFESMTSAL